MVDDNNDSDAHVNSLDYSRNDARPAIPKEEKRLSLGDLLYD